MQEQNERTIVKGHQENPNSGLFDALGRSIDRQKTAQQFEKAGYDFEMDVDGKVTLSEEQIKNPDNRRKMESIINNNLVEISTIADSGDTSMADLLTILQKYQGQEGYDSLLRDQEKRRIITAEISLPRKPRQERQLRNAVNQLLRTTGLTTSIKILEAKTQMLEEASKSPANAAPSQ